jgi:hypothetical protein
MAIDWTRCSGLQDVGPEHDWVPHHVYEESGTPYYLVEQCSNCGATRGTLLPR